MTYEEQLKKWAAKKYKIAGKDIDETTLNVEAYSNQGCPTCGPETEMEAHVVVYGLPDSRKKRKVLKTDTIVIDWSMNFSTIVKEIIEA